MKKPAQPCSPEKDIGDLAAYRLALFYHVKRGRVNQKGHEMPYLPFPFVWDGHFATLQPATGKVLYVVATIADYKSGEFYHSINTIATLAGVSKGSVKRALRELQQWKPPIIEMHQRPGKTAIRIYCPTRDRPESIQDVDNSARPGSPMIRGGITHDPGTRITHDPLTVFKTTEETTTQDISPKLVDKLIEKYGFDEVHARVVVISKMNGRVANKDGLLVDSLKHGYIPSDKELNKQFQENEKIKKNILALEAELEKVTADTNMTHFPDPASFGFQRTPEEVKEDLVERKQKRLNNLHSKLED